MSQVVELVHPLIKHHLTRLRDRETRPDEFRALVHRLSMLLAFEATKDLPLVKVRVRTPIQQTDGYQVQQRIGIVPILRAGLGMVDPVLELLPDAEVWHLGLYRDETTAQPVEYYSKLPDKEPVDQAFVLDPMLATGGSLASACGALTSWGVKKIKTLSIIAAPEGIQELALQFPHAKFYVCEVDERLNDQKFIVPGLGDAGDRTFNTGNDRSFS
jgi:uracil phosphoribosyltransferase